MAVNRKIDTNALVEVLGGTDDILQHYLFTNNTSSLTQSQLKSVDNYSLF